METQFKPIPPRKDYDENIAIDKTTNFDDEFKNSKRQLLIKKIITRTIAFLILLLIIFFFFIRKPNKATPTPENKIETPPVEDIKDEPIIKQEDKNQSITNLIPSPSPVNNAKTVAKPKLAKYELDGYVTIVDGEPIFSMCASSEDLLIVSSSPVYNYFYNKFNNLTAGMYNPKAYVIFKGRNVPAPYASLGSLYTQGFFIESISRMDLNGSCY